MNECAVIFDFGGVFIDSPFTAASDVAAERGIEVDFMLATLFGAYDSDTDHPWHRLERGELTFADARSQIIELSTVAGGPELDPVELLMVLGGGAVRQAAVEHCRALRSGGVRTGLLTNNAAEFAEFWRPLIPLDELFDDVVDSCEVGMRKPDRRIFELALDRLGVPASRAVFLDDAPGNVVAARSVGLHGVLVGPRPEDLPAALGELDRLVAAIDAGCCSGPQ